MVGDYKMKKLIPIFIAIFLLTGCANDKTREKQLEKAGRDYYEEFMSGIEGNSGAEISVSMLEKANTDANKKYKLSAFKECDRDETKVIFELEKNEIKKVKFSLDCE